MAEQTEQQAQGAAAAGKAARPAPAIHVAPGPHLFDAALTTRRMMLDVLIGLVPVVAWAVYWFRWYAVAQLGVCVLSCVAAEAIFTAMRRQPVRIGDLSAVVTGVILGLSLPGTCPVHVGVIGGFTAIGLGKVVFGGVGMNIFNPAMVGRAFVMIAFPGLLAAGGYIVKSGSTSVAAITQATPLTDFAQNAKVTPLVDLLFGTTNGSLGEVSAAALLIGGLYLCLRRTASWEIPVSATAGLLLVAGIDNLVHPGAQWTVLHHFLGGAFLFGALFIATDPVSSPLTPKGKWIFGFAFGVLVMLMRTFSAYPEGVMFSVLIVNALVPLINRWTIPRPVGGPVPAAVKK